MVPTILNVSITILHAESAADEVTPIGAHADFAEDDVDTKALFDTLEFNGLEPSKFWNLFVECARCGHIMPRNLHPYSHHCSKKTRDLSSPASAITTELVEDGDGSERPYNRTHAALEELKQIVHDATGEDVSNMDEDDILDRFVNCFPEEEDPQEDIVALLEGLV